VKPSCWERTTAERKWAVLGPRDTIRKEEGGICSHLKGGSLPGTRFILEYEFWGYKPCPEGCARDSGLGDLCRSLSQDQKVLKLVLYSEDPLTRGSNKAPLLVLTHWGGPYKKGLNGGVIPP